MFILPANVDLLVRDLRVLVQVATKVLEKKLDS